jgi:DNA-binding GntR family transcriptional regulator
MPDGNKRTASAERPPTTGSQTDAALELIRSRIIDLTLPPGSRIDEALLLKQFELGRTPAREAINRLVAEGFVRIAPNRGGTFVRRLDLADMGEVVVAHQLVENIAGQLCNLEDAALADDLAAIQEDYRQEVAARRFLRITELNERFHMRMNDSIDNSFYNDFARSTHRHVRRLLMQVYTLESARQDYQRQQFELNVGEHDRIIAAIRDHDRDELVRLLPAHAGTTQERLVEIIRSKKVMPFNVQVSTALPL